MRNHFNISNAKKDNKNAYYKYFIHKSTSHLIKENDFLHQLFMAAVKFELHIHSCAFSTHATISKTPQIIRINYTAY